ncbi:MAG: DUF2809 domain-containing protein [Bacteroidales bacterium]|nr:DUF2809 domain-containing protein [Bacteroidales bacterium]
MKNNTVEIQRNRIIYLLWVILAIISGLLSRKFELYLPDFVNTFLGDAIWAMMIYFGFAFILNTRKSTFIATISLIFCYLIEISQLYQANWINVIRHTSLGGLVLGFGFLWSDILAYSMGITLAYGLEVFYFQLIKKLLIK